MLNSPSYKSTVDKAHWSTLMLKKVCWDDWYLSTDGFHRCSRMCCPWGSNSTGRVCSHRWRTHDPSPYMPSQWPLFLDFQLEWWKANLMIWISRLWTDTLFKVLKTSDLCDFSVWSSRKLGNAQMSVKWRAVIIFWYKIYRMKLYSFWKESNMFLWSARSLNLEHTSAWIYSDRYCFVGNVPNWTLLSWSKWLNWQEILQHW